MSDQTSQSAAFLELYDQYAPRIFAFLYVRTKHRQVAEDLASTTWVKAWSAWRKKQSGNSKAWLFQIAHHVLVDHSRRTPDVLLEQFDRYAAPETMLPEQQLREIQQALHSLEPEQRDLIFMRVWDGLSFDEISEVVGTSPAACKMRFARGVAKMKETILPLIIFSLYVKLH